MAAKVKFPLKMANGSQVRTLEDLREHFDLISVLGYYDNGRLYDWLTVYYYNEEAEKINALDSSADDFKKSLCDILGVTYAENESVGVDLSDISERNERLAKLRTITADDAILAAVDSVVFTQQELDSLMGKDVNVIYLCGEQFNISADKSDVRYIGVNTPKVVIPNNFAEKNIVFNDVEFDLDGIIAQAKATSNHEEAARLWRIAMERGHAEAEYELGMCYFHGNGVEKNEVEAVKWWHKSAEQGYAEAQCRLGNCYNSGEIVDYDFDEAEKWFRKAAEQGHAEAQFKLGMCYHYEYDGFYDGEEKVDEWWWRKAAEQGHDGAVNLLFNNDDVAENLEWWRKLAEKGYAHVQYKLGDYYENEYAYGDDENDVDENEAEAEALKWYRKAAEQGHVDAQEGLARLQSNNS